MNQPPPYNPYAAPAQPDAIPQAAPVRFDGEPSPIGARIGAHLIDLFVVMAGMFMSIMVIVFAFPDIKDDTVTPFLAYLPGLAVQTIMQVAWGQSLGKRLLGLRVVMMDGTPASAAHVVLMRNFFPGLVMAFCGILGIVDIAMLFRADGMTWHDKVARTRVVRVGRAF
jgi:uncharacterized RDD family membrane protein YckC